jgi:hypothetical protein
MKYPQLAPALQQRRKSTMSAPSTGPTTLETMFRPGKIKVETPSIKWHHPHQKISSLNVATSKASEQEATKVVF